jgi:hypothetical protein
VLASILTHAFGWAYLSSRLKRQTDDRLVCKTKKFKRFLLLNNSPIPSHFAQYTFVFYNTRWAYHFLCFYYPLGSSSARTTRTDIFGFRTWVYGLVSGFLMFCLILLVSENATITLYCIIRYWKSAQIHVIVHSRLISYYIRMFSCFSLSMF